MGCLQDTEMNAISKTVVKASKPHISDNYFTVEPKTHKLLTKKLKET